MAVADDSAIIRRIAVPDRWLVHAYYTVSPYAPDGSDRIVVAGADLDRAVSEVLILSPDGAVMDRFGEHPLEGPTFFHTGRWQTWSADGRYVFYSEGTMQAPRFVRRELATGSELRVTGAMDGATPADGPLVSGLLGMLELAKDPARAAGESVFPIAFEDRTSHGLFEYALDPPAELLRLSSAEILDVHPKRDVLRDWDREIAERLGPDEALTLLTFCVRWSPDASRLLFFFGNNGVAAGRGEPRIKYVMTMRRDFSDVRLAVDLSFGRPGAHWFWQPDNEHLIGYGPDPQDPARVCLAEVRYDGSGYRKISDHDTRGHPSVSPADPDLVVTDHHPPSGRVTFLSRHDGQILQSSTVPLSSGTNVPPGRSQYRIDAHPVFHPSGEKVLCNSLPGAHAELVEIAVPGRLCASGAPQ